MHLDGWMEYGCLVAKGELGTERWVLGGLRWSCLVRGGVSSLEKSLIESRGLSSIQEAVDGDSLRGNLMDALQWEHVYPRSHRRMPFKLSRMA